MAIWLPLMGLEQLGLSSHLEAGPVCWFLESETGGHAGASNEPIGGPKGPKGRYYLYAWERVGRVDDSRQHLSFERL